MNPRRVMRGKANWVVMLNYENNEPGPFNTGLPVIGFAMQRRINGDLGGVRANYGGTSMHKYDTGLE